MANPLPDIAEARAFQQQMATWAGAPPSPEPVTVVGSHRLFATADRAVDA